MVIRPLCHLSRMLCLKLFVLNACFIWFSWFKNYVGLPNIDKYLYIHNFIKLHVYNKPIFILCDFFLKQEVNLKSHGFSEKLALVAYSPLYFSYKVSFHEDNSKLKKKSWYSVGLNLNIFQNLVTKKAGIGQLHCFYKLHCSSSLKIKSIKFLNNQ